jgi:hypothetical protein
MHGGRRQGAGRKAGSSNRASAEANAKIEATCDKYDYDPIEAMVVLATDPDVPVGLRTFLHKEIAQYRYAKLRAVEIRGSDDHPVTVIHHRYGQAPGGNPD